MLKKIDSSQLRVGMAIHDLDCGWMEHPFVRSKFKLSSVDEIRKIRTAGIRGVVIDCSKGLDVQDAPTVAEAEATIEAQVLAIAAKPVAATAEIRMELRRGTSSVTVMWPSELTNDCGAWLRE